MKRAIVDGFGDTSRLRIEEVDDPTPAAGEIVIQIEAAAIERSDLAQREGLYVGGPKPPFVPGSSAAGVVIAHGEGVTAPALGTRVLAFARGGLHAERATVPAAHCVALPAAAGSNAAARDVPVSIEVAAFVIGALTAYHALAIAHAREGELALIHGAAGSVGGMAVQIAKRRGLRVVATASTTERRAHVRTLGADLVTDVADFDTLVRQTTRDGAALVIDPIGGDVTRRSLHVLAPLGRLVLVGIAERAPVIDPVKLLYRSQAILGLHLDAILAKPAGVAASLDWLFAQSFATRIAHAIPLADIAGAHALAADRATLGKVVLVNERS